MVTVRMKLLSIIFWGIFEAIAIKACYDSIHEDIINWKDLTTSSIMVICTTLGMGWLITNRIIFDDNGMRVKEWWGFLFLTFLKRDYSVPWDDIKISCEYRNIWEVFVLSYFVNEKYRTTVLGEEMHKNYKKALKLIVQKLPQERFDDHARKKLKKMRIGEWADDVPLRKCDDVPLRKHGDFSHIRKT